MAAARLLESDAPLRLSFFVVALLVLDLAHGAPVFFRGPMRSTGFHITYRKSGAVQGSYKMYFGKILVGLILVAGGSAIYSVSSIQSGMYFDVVSVILVIGSIIPATYFIVREKVAHWADVCLALGVPVGLLGGTVGATGMALNLASPDIVFPATAIMLLTVLYGGLISAIGYFAQRQARSPSQASLSNGLFAIALIPFLGIIGWCMSAAAGIGAFFTPATLFVFYGVFAATFYFLKKVSSQDLVNAALFSSMLCLVAGLIQWYQSDGTDRSAIAFAMNGLNCGLLIYIVVYLWSLRSRTESIEAGKANWHWMEVSAFLVFMLFAPETIRETLINQQDEEAALIENAELEDRLALLEKRLALLEGS